MKKSSWPMAVLAALLLLSSGARESRAQPEEGSTPAIRVAATRHFELYSAAHGIWVDRSKLCEARRRGKTLARL